MDDKPKCSRDVEPRTQQPKQKDQSAVQKDQTTPPEEQTPATKSPTALTKEHPAYLEAQSTVPKIQTVLTIDQAIYSIDQPALFKDPTAVYSRDQLAYSKSQNALTEDQSAEYSKHQLAHFKCQNALTIDQAAVVAYSKDELADSKTQNVVMKEEPAVPTVETSFPKIHIASRKIKSSSLEEQTATSTIHIDSTKDEPRSSKEPTIKEIHTVSTKDESASSRELTMTPKIQIASTTDETPFSKEKTILTTEAGSTKNKSAMTATPKKLVETTMENYSKKIESGISLCAGRGSATPSCNVYSDYISSNAPLKSSSSTQSPITTQPVSQSPLAISVAVLNQPPTLFLQALSKLNESSLTFAVISHFKLQSSTNLSKVFKIESGEITPPDSLSSAPPTYSFVLRQLAVRRRPRFMGTFFPSPSFVQHAPPPTYTGAFDVYIEPALPPPPARVYTFGFTSMPIVCPECGYTGMTVVTSHTTICTHLCAFILCLLCCWICAPLPYILRSCKDVYHYCRNCRSFLGMYCPTNPESAAYSNVP